MRDHSSGLPPTRSRFLAAWLVLAAACLLFPGTGSAQRIKVLEADTLRSSERDEPGMEIVIDVDDSTRSSVRITSSRWKRRGEESASLVRFGEDIVIAADEVVDGAVIAFGGDIVVRGRVLEDAVSFGGSVTLDPGAVVEGDAVAFGGSVVKADDAELLGEDVTVAFVPSTFTDGIELPGGGRTFWMLFLTTTFLFLAMAGLLIDWILPVRVRAMADQVRLSLWPSFFVGLAAQVLLGPAIALLCVTIIGIPIGILVLPLAFATAQTIGYLCVVALVGARVFDAGLETRPHWVRALLAGLGIIGGATLLAALLASLTGLVAGIGRLLLLCLLVGHWTMSTIGLGGVLLSRFGKRPAPLGPESTGGTLGDLPRGQATQGV